MQLITMFRRDRARLCDQLLRPASPPFRQLPGPNVQWTEQTLMETNYTLLGVDDCEPRRSHSP